MLFVKKLDRARYFRKRNALDIALVAATAVREARAGAGDKFGPGVAGPQAGPAPASAAAPAAPVALRVTSRNAQGGGGGASVHGDEFLKTPAPATTVVEAAVD